MTLKKQMDKAAALGYTMVTGPEAEFFLFRRDANGDPIVDTHDEGAYFDLTPVDRGEEARRDIVLALEQMGFEVEAAHHEVAPGQHEIDFKYADAVTTADRVSTFRFIVKKVAHGPRPARDLHAEADLRRERIGHARAPVVPRQEGEQRLLRREGEVPALQDGPPLHRRHPAPREGLRRGHEPARQLLQAPRARATRRRSTWPGRCATARPSCASRRGAAWGRASRSACRTRRATPTSRSA